jgi:hypothetical protein
MTLEKAIVLAEAADQALAENRPKEQLVEFHEALEGVSEELKFLQACDPCGLLPVRKEMAGALELVERIADRVARVLCHAPVQV